MEKVWLKYLVLLFFYTSICSAQTKKNNSSDKKEKQEKKHFLQQHKPRAIDFHALGHSFFFDLNLSPIQAYAADSTTPSDTLPIFSRISQMSIYNISYHFRLNLFRIDDDHAVSLTLNPGLGIGISQSKKINGFGAFTGAALLGYEWGLGSTYRSALETGGCVKAGIEYTRSPLTGTVVSRPESEIREWINAVISFGVRKENQKRKLLENNFKIGFGTSTVDELNGVNPYRIARSFSFRYSFVVYLDY